MSEDGKAWLDQLETTVKQAAGAIEALRRERDDLASRVQELEARLGELEAAGGDGAGDGAAAAWRKERKEIRRRVQKLTQRLEGLLGEKQ